MIQLGTIKIIILLSICLALNLNGAEEISHKPEKKTVFSEVKQITVLPVICGSSKIDPVKIRAALEKALAAIGKTQPDKADNFGKGNSVLEVLIGPIAEENLVANTPAKTLPVFSISMQLSAGASLLSNSQFLVSGCIWQEEAYVSENQKDLTNVIERQVTFLLDHLKKKYENAGTTPTFYVSSISSSKL